MRDLLGRSEAEVRESTRLIRAELDRLGQEVPDLDFEAWLERHDHD